MTATSHEPDHPAAFETMRVVWGVFCRYRGGGGGGLFSPAEAPGQARHPR